MDVYDDQMLKDDLVMRYLGMKHQTREFSIRVQFYNQIIFYNLVLVLQLIYGYNHVHLKQIYINEIFKLIYIHGSQTSSKVPKSGVPTISNIFVN